MSYLLVATTNRVSHPDDAWPQIADGMTRVAQHHSLERVGLGLHTAQEIRLAREMLVRDYTVELMPTDIDPIAKSWQPVWIRSLLDLVNSPDVYLEWYDRRDAVMKRMPPNHWRMAAATAFVVIRATDEPELHENYVEHAKSINTPAYRIDPDSYEVSRYVKRSE